MVAGMAPTTIRSRLQQLWWTRDSTYCISTDVALVAVDKLNDAFGSSGIYWAKTMPREVLRETLQNSLCFGLYTTDAEGEVEEMIGFARCITDFTTFVYLTDVYVWPEHQGKGLGKWLLQCVQMVIEDMPHLRRSVLITSDWERSVPFYEKVLDMTTIQTDTAGHRGTAVMQHLGPGIPTTF